MHDLIVSGAPGTVRTTTTGDGSDESTDHDSVPLLCNIGQEVAVLVDSQTGCFARFTVTAGDIVDDGFASALSS